ncbi:MAG TPA: hypothetical protein PLG79_09530, partial [Spirochaetales bacterium]|nr:hypothetical protein [Spirochaetales bacterium]
MHRKVRRIIFSFLLIFFLGAGLGFGTDYTWDGNGDGTSWNDPINWTADSGFPSGAGDTATFGSFTVTLTNIPVGTAAGTVTINNTSADITLGSNLTVDALVVSDGSLSIGSNTLTVTGAISINGTGTLTIASSGSLNAAGVTSTGTIFSSGSISCTNFSSTGTFTNTGVNTLVSSGNVTLSGTFGGTATDNTLTMTGTGSTLNASVGIGNLIVNPGASNTVNLGAALSLAGNFTVSSGTFNSAGYAISIGGNLSNNAGASGLSLGTTTLTLNGTGAQSITMGGSSVDTVVLNNNGGSISFGDALTVTNSLSVGVNKAFSLSFNANAGGQTSTIAGSTTLDNTGTVTLGNDAGDNITFSGGLTATAPTTISLAGTINSSNASISLGATTLTTSTTIDTGAGVGNIEFASTLNGAQNLTLSSGTGTITFVGAAGDIDPIGTGTGAALTINSGVTEFQSTL